MKLPNTNRNKAILTVLTILVVSLMLNVYQSLSIANHKKQIDRISCDNIENIRNRNENILCILEKTIESKILTNEELLTLYKNYTEIATSEIALWEDYLTLEDNSSIFGKNKKIKALEVSRTEILWDIEAYIYSYLKSQMGNSNSNIELSGTLLSEFSVLRSMSDELNEYFNKFTEKYLSDKEGQIRSDLIVKKHYWIDMLFGVVETTDKYVDYEFVLK